MSNSVETPFPFSGGPEGRALFASPGSESPENSRPSGPPLNGRQKFAALASDIKLQHSVFALPWAILATVLAAHRMGGLKIGQLILILICMVTARTVAMVANRILDINFDLANPRTARRALPSGRLSKPFMWGSLVISAALLVLTTAGFLVLYHNAWPLVLALPVLFFLVGYSLMKRYTRFCHYYLGAALGLAPVCAWLAITGTLALAPVYMMAAVLFWTAGFDIFYACQDYEFDVTNRLFSVPAKLGIGPALWVARCSHLICVAFLILLFQTTPELRHFFLAGILLVITLLIVEHRLVTEGDLSRLNLAFFTLNGVISVVLGTLGAVDILLHR